MKTLVVYFSRTGKTRTVGQMIAKELGANTDDILDLDMRKSFLHTLIFGSRKALKKKKTKITHVINPNNYDLVIIGSPTWAGRVTPAVRTYLENHKPKKVAFFCTFNGDSGKVLPQLEELTSKPIATLEVGKVIDQKAVKEFCSKLKKK